MGSQPDMSSTVLSFAQIIVKKVVTQSVINHRTVKAYVESPFESTVTTPKTQDLLQIEVNTALKYKLSHSVDSIKIDDIFVHKLTEYKVISLSDRDDYGYYRAIGEEVQ